MLALHAVSEPALTSSTHDPAVEPLPLKYMFLSVMLLALENSAPRVVLPWIVPPWQSVPPIWLESQRPETPPVPVTVKLPPPVRALTVMPLAAPLELILWNTKAPVAVPMLTAVPVVDVTSLNVKALAPLLAIVTAPPVVEVTLLNVTPVPDVSLIQLMPLPLVVVMVFALLTLTVPP